jgi:carboxymethylenebutenolidase
MSPVKSIFQKIFAGVKILFSLPMMTLFLLKNGRPQKHFAAYEAVTDELKKSHGIKNVGMVGYCYGGGVCLHMGSKADKIDAFATAHTEIKVPDSFNPLVKPGLFICADKDWAFPDAARKKAEELLKDKPAGKYVIKHYPGTYHGFAVRGHDDKSTVEAAKKDAFKTMVDFFNENMPSPTN